MDLNNIVFEVTERNSVDDIKGFKDPIKYAMVKSMVEFARTMILRKWRRV